MRKFSVILSIVAVMTLVPQAFATDCDTRQALQYSGWDYAITHLDTSSSDCWTPGTYSPAWDSDDGMWEFSGYVQQQIQRVVTVPGGDSGSNDWTVLLYVDFYSPSSDYFDMLNVDVDVNHGGSHTGYNICSIRGSVTSSDSGYKYNFFTAQNGDTITLTIWGACDTYNSGGRSNFKYVWLERSA